MRAKLFIALLATLAAAGAARAQPADLVTYVPGDAEGYVEARDLAGLRQIVLESEFWARLKVTDAYARYEEGPHSQRVRDQIGRLAERMGMTPGEMMKAYFSGRTVAVGLPGGDHRGILMTETDNASALALLNGLGAVRAGEYEGVTLYEVTSEEKIDQLAIAGGVLLVSGNTPLEPAIDVIQGRAPSLAEEPLFADLAADLPAGWDVRAWGRSGGPRHAPGAAAAYVYPDRDLVHVEWRSLGQEPLGPFEPVALAVPGVIPADAAAAAAGAMDLPALWRRAQDIAADNPRLARKLARAELLIPAFFPGYDLQTILAAFGPEAGLALMPDADGQAPALVGVARLAPGGRPVAESFRDGLASKIMLMAGLAGEKGPQVSVRYDEYAATRMLTIEAGGPLLDRLMGERLGALAPTIAVTDNWLIVGTTVDAVRAVLDTAAGGGPSLAASGRGYVPALPVSQWGTVEPGRTAELLGPLLERRAPGRIGDVVQLARLVDRLSWRRIDGPGMVRGSADIDAP